MRIAAIVAMDRGGVIGSGGRLPWHLPRDLRRFRENTWGKPIIMGRNTFRSLPRPLPGRFPIVLSRAAGLSVPGGEAARSVAEALSVAAAQLAVTGGDEAMIIGGGHVFRETAGVWDRIYMTLVEAEFPGDVTFPLDRLRQVRWRLVAEERCAADARNAYSHRFALLERPAREQPTADDFDIDLWLAPGE
jgi:dihydrofolate reductase